MKVRVLVGVCDHRRSYAGGEVCELPDDQADRWIKAGLAEPVNERVPATVHEAAALATPKERATYPPPRRRE